jgi:hypothetical protein
MTTRHVLAPIVLLFASATLTAAEPGSQTSLFPDKPSRVWQIDWTTSGAPSPIHAALATMAVAETDQTSAPPRAVEYSHAYQVRARIHKGASFATLPLFATEIALGQSLYNTPGGGKKTAHAIVGAGIGGLFAVNTVTGAWNLWEARADPAGRKRRLAHGLLMMAADAGFFATFLATPNAKQIDFTDARGTHRTIALTSIGLATAGYFTMLFGGK